VFVYKVVLGHQPWRRRVALSSHFDRGHGRDDSVPVAARGMRVPVGTRQLFATGASVNSCFPFLLSNLHNQVLLKLPVIRMEELYTIERDFVGFQHAINCLRFSQQSGILAVGSDEGTVAVLDPIQGAVVSYWKANAPVTALLWQPNTMSLFVGYGDGGISCIDTANRDNRLVGHLHVS
jgi:WD40 repeat protein